MMKLAVMQPYIFPYIGYFQLLKNADIFVFYDDVNYIKGGWINRNQILINAEKKMFTVPCIKASPNKKINEIPIDYNHKLYKNITKSIVQNYRKAPHFEVVFPIIEDVLSYQASNIGQLAGYSIIKVAAYLGLEKTFRYSSISYHESCGKDRAERLVDIIQKENASTYINMIGGEELYSKAFFKSYGIDLLFLNPQLKEYPQSTNPFVEGLSIIDIMMYNSKEEIMSLLEGDNILT